MVMAYYFHLTLSVLESTEVPMQSTPYHSPGEIIKTDLNGCLDREMLFTKRHRTAKQTVQTKEMHASSHTDNQLIAEVMAATAQH